MVFEETRFTHSTDEEFRCSICTIILKEPTQGDCQHLFCNECIEDWPTVNESCPACQVERESLKLECVNPVVEGFHNLMNNYEINYEFESRGCAAIPQLETLEVHVGRCECNRKVICNMGCNIEMSQYEYQRNNCFKHLADQVVRQEKKISNLKDHVTRQDEKIEQLTDEMYSLRRREEEIINKIATLDSDGKSQLKIIDRLNDELNSRGVDITRLNDEMYKLRIQMKQLQNENISNATNVLVEDPAEFRVWNDMETSKYQPNILEVDKGCGCAQSNSTLHQTNFTFKIEILALRRYISIGLHPMRPTDRSPSQDDGVILYQNDGSVLIDGKYEQSRIQWNVGDIIECGVNFPRDFVNDGRRVQVYFHKNEEFILQKYVTMPIGGLFPTVYMLGGSKIRFLSE